MLLIGLSEPKYAIYWKSKKFIQVWPQISILRLNYAIRWYSEKSVCSYPREAEVADQETIALKIFSGKKLGLSGAKYVIWRDSEKSASGGSRYPTVADWPPLAHQQRQKHIALGITTFAYICGCVVTFPVMVDFIVNLFKN